MRWRWMLVGVLLLVGGPVAGYLAGPSLARAHATVRLAELLHAEASGTLSGASLEIEAFRGTGRPTAEVYREARQLQERFEIGGALLGLWLALAAVVRLARSGSTSPTGITWYDVDQAACLACARCFSSCPVGREPV